MRAIGGFRVDRETGHLGITVAGLLVFGTPVAIREWRTRHLIDFRSVAGDVDPDSCWDNRIAWEGNLFDAFDAIFPALTSGLRVPFRIDQGTRIDESQVHVALREALVNLLVHADYAETQASLIIRSPEGYLFRNPGSSRVLEADMLAGDRSDPRNPEIVRMFRHAGLAEEAGTGIPKILQAWRDLGFRLPAIDVGTERYEFSLILRHAHLLSDADRDWLHSLGSDWRESEQLALIVAKHDGHVDNSKLRNLTGHHPADATKVLGSLRDRGLLQMKGSGRTARYELGPAARVRLIGDGSDQEDRHVSSSQRTLDLSYGGMDLRSEGMDLRSGPITGEPRDQSGLVSAEIWAQLRTISSVARSNHRLTAATRDGIIIRLCSVTPLSSHELSDLLRRNEDYVKRALRRLVGTGYLRFMYPDQPNHPRQQYVAVVPNAQVRPG